MEPISVCNHTSDLQNQTTAKRESDLSGHEKYNFQRFWWRYEHWCCHSGKFPKMCTQTSNSRSTRKSNDESIKIQLILALVIVIMNITNRTEWSPFRSVIIRVIYKIRRPRSGSPICQSQVWLQTELDDTKSCYQLIITITIFEEKKTLRRNISSRDNV